MRISYLRMDYFKGIWNGMNKTSVEINFDAPYSEGGRRNVIVMLVGANGSGKTTLLSALHPFMDSQDDRKSIIMEDQEGYKEIHIVDGEDVYVIKHYYKEKGNKSYIEKNGVELNRNGGVTVFKDLVKEHLGIDQDFFKIGRIGSNVTNFIDFTTTERKTYISKFLPDIDDYLMYYKRVNEKFKKLKKEIQVVADQITKLDSKESLENLRDASIKQKEDKENEISETFGLISRNEGKLSSLDPDGSLVSNGNPFSSDYNEARRTEKESSRRLEAYFTKYPQLESYDLEKATASIEERAEKIRSIDGQLAGIEKDLESIRSQVVEHSNDKRKKEASLKEIKMGESIDGLREMVAERQEALRQIAAGIADGRNKFKKYLELNHRQIISVKSVLEQCQKAVLSIKNQYADDYLDAVVAMVEKGIFVEGKLKETLKSSKMTLARLEDNLKKLEGHMSILRNNEKQKETLKLRPSACRIDSCEFIRSALRYQNIDKDIEAKQEQIDSAESEIETQKELIEFNEEVLSIFNILANSYDPVERSKGIIMKLPAAFDLENFFTYCKLIKESNKRIGEAFDVSELLEFMEAREEYDVEKGKLDNVKEKLSILEQQASIIEAIEQEVADIGEKIDALQSRKEELELSKEDLDASKSKEEARLTVLKDLQALMVSKRDASKVLSNLKDKYERAEKTIETISEILSENDRLQKKHEYLKRELGPISKRLEDASVKLSKLQEYELRKESLESNYSIIESVKVALDPNKGIPLHFIGGYLKDTALIANDLLDLAYQGKFRIKKFEIDEKEFFIPIRKENGDELRDIKDASQGETALTTISLSLAMIQQSISKQSDTIYNILELDEIDSTLDVANRINFIYMLEKQIEQLGLEQVFIISHNNQFDAYPVDLILLNGHTMPLEDEIFMKNKKIIFNIAEAG